jgi:hypothetical protein
MVLTEHLVHQVLRVQVGRDLIPYKIRHFIEYLLQMGQPMEQLLSLD